MYKLFILQVILLCNCYERNVDSFIRRLRRRDTIPLHEISRRSGVVYDGNYRRTKDIRDGVEERRNDDSSYRLKAALLRENGNNVEPPDLRLAFNNQEWLNMN